MEMFPQGISKRSALKREMSARRCAASLVRNKVECEYDIGERPGFTGPSTSKSTMLA
jgi:hypothetical protein